MQDLRAIIQKHPTKILIYQGTIFFCQGSDTHPTDLNETEDGQDTDSFGEDMAHSDLPHLSEIEPDTEPYSSPDNCGVGRTII